MLHIIIIKLGDHPTNRIELIFSEHQMYNIYFNSDASDEDRACIVRDASDSNSHILPAVFPYARLPSLIDLGYFWRIATMRGAVNIYSL